MTAPKKEYVAKARMRYLGVSAQKTRLVVDLVRGKNVGDALSILHYTRKHVARDVEKLVKSAVANAQQKDQKLDVDRLVIAKAMVDEGPPMKRARSRSMGRVYRILKKTCHVSIALDLAKDKGAGAPTARR